MTLGLSKRQVKLCRLNKAICIDINLLELIQSAIFDASPLHHRCHFHCHCKINTLKTGKNMTLGLNKGLVKLCRLNKAIIIDINLLELVQSAIVAASPYHCFFQTDQTIPVEIKTEEIFHRIALN